MHKFHKLSLITLALCASGALVACGTEAGGQIAGGATQAGALTEAEALVGEHLLFIGEGQSEGEYGVSCLNIRSYLFAARQALKAGFDWGNVIRTDGYKTFGANYKIYKDAGCSKGDTRIECEDLRAKIVVDTKSIAATPEWAVLTKNSKYQAVAENYAKALAINCIAHTGI